LEEKIKEIGEMKNALRERTQEGRNRATPLTAIEQRVIRQAEST